MAKSLPIPDGVFKREDGRWCKNCHGCGEEQSYLRRNYCINSYLECKLCKKCSNRKPENSAHKGWVLGVLRLSFARKYEANAALRGIPCDVSYVYLAKLLISQNNQCALTGFHISALEVCNNASLDRIDSSLGYIEGNLQWLHKDVNMMKQQYSQKRFIDVCVAVAKKVKQKNFNS